MIEILRQVLPYALVLYFVVKGIKEPLYFLGIAFLMIMSNSIFFQNAKIFFIPGSFGLALGFIWIILIWILFSIAHLYIKTKKTPKIRQLTVLDYFILGLLLITFVGLGTVIINYPSLTYVFKEFVTMISLFVGYFIIKDMCSNSNPETLLKFLFSILVINSIASVLFILHQGLHIKIYQESEYSISFFQGELITRTFWFMPQFLAFSIASGMIFRDVYKEKKFFVLILLLVNFFAVFISYTRSALINSVIIILLYFVFIGIKKKSLILVIKNYLVFIVVGIICLMILLRFMPAKVKYFSERFEEVSNTTQFRESNNLKERFLNTKIIISRIELNKKIIGEGPVTNMQLAGVTEMKGANADMVWVGVIFRWGYLGLVLFILLYVTSVIKAFKLFIRSDGFISYLALLILLMIISQIIESFVSWTFMSEHGFAIGLWYFAILSVLLGYKKNEVSPGGDKIY
jgi:hypothetical protein